MAMTQQQPIPLSSTVDRIVQDLRSKNDENRQKAAHMVRQTVENAHRELPPQAFQQFYNDVNMRISQLIVAGNDSSERIGGIYALNSLIDFRGDDAGQKTTRFASYLRSVMRGTDNTSMVVAAKALGRLAKPGGTLTAELVEAEVKVALEWLQMERTESRRFAAVLILRELAKNSPTLMYQWIAQIFEVIWVALRDPKVLIRESAAEAISACFEIISPRDHQMRQMWFGRVYDEILKGFNLNTNEAIHGSLLTMKELLDKSAMFMNDQKYKETVETVLKYREHRDALVRREVVLIIPILASYSPTEFAAKYLHQCMLHLQGLIRKDRDRDKAFMAIGQIANAVGVAIAPYLDGILGFIQDGLTAKARNKAINEAPIFQCLSMIAAAVGQALSKNVERLLDPIFSCGLSDSLFQALVDMAHYVPPCRPIIQEKLLDLLSQILAGRHYLPLGSPHQERQPPHIWTRDHKDPTIIASREQEIALALHTLGSFDFTGHVLNEFVRDVAIRYVEADNPEIRKRAALTCCQLFVKDPIVHQTSVQATKVVGDIIEKLLTVGVGDIDPEIRWEVLMALDARFDRHLGKADNIRTLFLALNDEVFAIREAAMSIIGRLTVVNPAYVFPSLRKVLLQLLTEVNYSNSPRSKEESARLISNLVGAADHLIKPLVDPIVAVLLPKAKDANPEVASTTLKAIGDLATVGGESMTKYIPELMPIILDFMQDLASDSKRFAALRALGQLATNVGYVVEPYRDYPELMNILMNIVKTEPEGELRRETVKLMGTIGALDPDEYQKIMEQSPDKHLILEAQAVTDVSLIMQGITPSNEEYYPTIVINTLMGLLKDTSLSQFHSSVVDAVMNIYATMGLKCVPFLNMVVPGFLQVIRAAPTGRTEGYFNQLSQLVRIVRQHIRPYLPSILATIQDFWSSGTQLQATILSLIESIAKSLEGEFKVYLADVLPLMLGVMEADQTSQRVPSTRVLHAFLIFGSSAEEYMHLIVPVIVNMFDKPGQPVFLRKLAMETLGRLSKQVNISEFSARIVQPICRVLAGNDTSLKQAALETLCALIFQLGPDYIHFVPTVNKILITHKVPNENYGRIVSKLQRGEPLPQDLSPDERYGEDDEDINPAEIQTKKLAVNQQHLKQAWEASSKTTREDWVEWIRRFSVELLRESPQQALRACTPLASVYNPIARTLFNSAFVSCWTELYDQYQEELVRSIETALTSPNIPPEILQILLNLAEFMEHDDKALPIDVRILGMYAGKCHAFAKALHYKELEFNAEQNSSAVEALISINNQLQQTDAAFGILRKAQGYSDVELKETWFEKLQKWEEALTSYQRRERDEPDSFEITMGKMRCLHALGEWDLLSSLSKEKWANASQEYRKAIAPLAAAGAWGMGKFADMDSYLTVMKEQSPDRAFFASIVNIHNNRFEIATEEIAKARRGLDTELSSLLGESYQRAYLPMIRVQMLAELEEIMLYKQNDGNLEKQASMRRTWMKRLKGLQPNPEVWQRMMKVRQLVITPQQSLDMWIKYTNLCRKNERMGLAEKGLQKLLDIDNGDVFACVRENVNKIPYPVSYAAFKLMWGTPGHREEALDLLKDFTARLADDVAMRARAAQNGMMPPNGMHGMTNGHAVSPMNPFAAANGVNGMNGSSVLNGSNMFSSPTELVECQRLLAKCYHKVGEWQSHIQNGEWDHEQVHEILSAYSAATRYNRDWYKAWHSWALANFEVVNSLTSQADRESTELPPNVVHEHIVPAITGFFKSIALSSSSSLQDTLRLLTLWFSHGGISDVNRTVSDGTKQVPIDTWLEVIPQLLARINQPNPTIRQSIHQLLSEVGKAHPQALVFPLTVSMKSDQNRRQRSAKELMEAMREHSPRLVEQADLVSTELVRIAVLWHEQWHEGLEEASRLYFGDHNIEGMFATLAPLHAMIDRGPETLREISFIQSFGRELQEARDWCNTFRTSGEMGDLNQAWDLYYQVFRKISRQLPSLMTLELQYVSPKLKEAHDLELAVPGTYQVGKPVIRISSFSPVASVIQSKQRPRKLEMQGSDGKTHTHILKGHEDIRQDERVMQLFGLCNTLLTNDTESRKRHLNIQGYAVVPLSTQSGLIGFVPNSDTLHVLIREYRDSRKILLNIEHRIMLQMAPDYDCLTLMQKVEVFGYALDNTTGQDLYRVLWLKSKSSEAWLDRRTNYTRSLAVMSMVGYILGLGDRHPSNLMLDRVTGKIVHIDFGDCFEVAMHREKYPERVPFRLTRMLTYAMEVSNIEGSYRTTCEHVMRVLRTNKESVMAVLEAFIHDPLLTWRLGARDSPPEPNFPSERRASIIGVPPSSSTDPTDPMSSLVSGRQRHRSSIAPQPQNEAEAKEVQNARALQVLSRVKEKLTGRDFGNAVGRGDELNVPTQVDRLIKEATNLENLCQHYIGWCSFW
ncbi:phosphatidylinositol kinase- protein kinase tor1 [Didymosphaeria variabile]|uniref:non-specific serine/threonine protein kinase n=1 Tax=Didymosphaeria variabile TaxID=1932322 RepID=A0A9W8XG27_9PLEO|nr:phosphatidylinositol kinase- protein kinase tor1 [Didymosphaeria variabile]KAJ4349705.1 phosphatidylinositol kinase- protein kinase tor1 [Didymosphaeria variabile]